jgi:hypothetical protein
MPDIPAQVMRRLPPAPRGIPARRLRGDGPGVPVQIYQAEEHALSLRCEMDRGQVVLCGIIGQGYDAAPPILVRLLRADAAPAAETLVEGSSFELGPVPPGDYQIEILLPDRLLVIAALTLPPRVMDRGE